MQVQRIVSKLLCSNMYIVIEQQHALIVDPCVCEPELNDVTFDRILLTHEHYDHISGVNYWKNKSGASLLCSESCAAGCIDPVKNISRYFTLFCDIQTWVKQPKRHECGDYTCDADETFQEQYSFLWQGHDVRLFALPGHSAGGTGIVIDKCILFSGDSVIRNHPISCNMPGGSRRQWNNKSLPQIQRLSKDIMVYPGHFESFILSEYVLD